MYIFITVLLSAILYMWLAFEKMDNAFNNHNKILKAIETYAIATDNCDMALGMLEMMEDYHKTVWRFWDWGCKNILPKGYFEILKPYID